MRRVAFVFVAVAMVILLCACEQLFEANVWYRTALSWARAHADPEARRLEILRNGALHAKLLGLFCFVAALVPTPWLSFATWRHHWHPRTAAQPSEPPYR